MTKTYRSRKVLKSALLVIMGVVLLWKISRLSKAVVFPVDDFVEYWAACRLHLASDNPYSPERLYAVEKSVGWQGKGPLMMWNPPWTLFFVMPFGMLGYPISRILWLLTHLVLVFLCADWLWRFYGGATQHRWLAWVIGCTFLPSSTALILGQISPLILLGLVGFLWFQRRSQFWLSGLSALPIAIKPHLLSLFWIAFLLWGLHRKRWSALLGGVVALLLATAVLLITNPDLISLYMEAIAKYSILHQPTPTFGALLRLQLGWERRWIQFLPTILGAIWFIFYWQRYRLTWQWDHHMPILLLVSVMTTSYGWIFDQVVLLPAIIQVGVWVLSHRQHPSARWAALIVYACIDGLILVIILLRLNELSYVWTCPAFLAGYLIYRKFVFSQRLCSNLSISGEIS